MWIKKRLLEGFFFIFSGRVGAGLLTLIITPIIVRLLGSGGYGDYAFSLAVYSTLRTVSGGGIYEGARKFISESTEIDRRSAVFRYYLNIAVVFGLSVSFLLAAGTYFLVGPVILEARLRPYLFLVAMLVFLHPFFYLVRSSLMGFELERFSEPLIVLDKVFLALVGVSLVYLGFHVEGMLIGHIVALALIIVIGYLSIRKSTDLAIRGSRVFVSELSALYNSRMFRYSVLTIVFVALTKSLYTVDILLLQPFTSSQEVGHYRAALLFAEFLWFVPYAVQIALLHSTARLWAEKEVAQINFVSRNITRYTLLLAGVLAVVLAAVGDSLLPIYFGAEFSVAYLPMLLLLPGAICFAVARPIYAIGQGHGNITLLIYSTGAASVLNLALNLLLIPEFGMYGAAVATSIGYGSMVIFHNWAAGKIGFHPLRNVRIVPVGVTVLTSLVVVVYLDTLVHSAAASLALIPLTAVLVFGALAMVSGALEIGEVSQLKEEVFTG